MSWPDLWFLPPCTSLRTGAAGVGRRPVFPAPSIERGFVTRISPGADVLRG